MRSGGVGDGGDHATVLGHATSSGAAGDADYSDETILHEVGRGLSPHIVVARLMTESDTTANTPGVLE